MNGKEIQNIVDVIRKQAKRKNRDKCFELLSVLIDEIKNNNEIPYLKKEELVKFVNRAFLLFPDYVADEEFLAELIESENNKSDGNLKYIATMLNLLGELYYYKGNFDVAEKKYNESLKIREEKFGEDHPLTVECKSNLALLLTERGKFREAEEIYDAILSVYEKEMDDYMEEYLYTLMNSGLLYRKWGEYSKSIDKYINALELSKTGKYKRVKDEIINNIGVFNLETANYFEAEACFEKSFEFCSGFYGKNHPLSLTTKNNLAIAKLHVNKKEEAKKILKSLLEVIPEITRNHPRTIKIYINLASILIKEGAFNEAEEELRRILNNKDFSIQRDVKIKILSNLAKIKLYQKNTEECLKIIEQILSEQEKMFGKKNIQYTKMLSLKALALIQNYKNKEASKELQKAVGIQNEILFNVSTSFSQDYAWNFLYKIADDINIYLSFFAEKKDENSLSIQEVYESILKRKAIVFETSIERYKNILNEKNPVLRQQYDELIKIKEEIILRTTKGYFHEQKDENEKKIRELSEKVSIIENKIAMVIPSYKFEKEIKNVSLKILQEKLKENTLFVDFFKYRKFDFLTPQNKFIGESYIIFYIDKETIKYEIIEEAQELDKKIKMTDINKNPDNRGVSGKKFEDSEFVSDEEILSYLYKKVFKNFDGQNQKKYTKLCISTDGEFTKLPFEILIDRSGKYLIEDFEIYYVSSGRHIINSTSGEKNREGLKKELLMFANPAFYVESNEKKDSESEHFGKFRGSSTVFRNELDEFPPLPGTKEEVSAINSLIQKDKIESINIFYDKQVNDTEIKKINSPLILHLATHGFYLDSRTDIHPFSRCGVALSGVNNMLRGEPLEDFLEDGLLTATDSLSLRLMDTELVILSACRTGAGEVRNGEGVLGLSSAFLCAGASSVILSLWNVPDFFTVELMTAFYEGIFAGNTKSKSLRDAKLKMIKKLRTEWGEAPTWIWGGFILFGDNNPIFS
jgi:CHAT domain-containing protein/Flp pilus assembly protein TadD